METIEILILKNLLHSEEYGRKVLPFIKKDYFENTSQKIVFEEISKFLTERSNYHSDINFIAPDNVEPVRFHVDEEEEEWDSTDETSEDEEEWCESDDE